MLLSLSGNFACRQLKKKYQVEHESQGSDSQAVSSGQTLKATKALRKTGGEYYFILLLSSSVLLLGLLLELARRRLAAAPARNKSAVPLTRLRPRLGLSLLGKSFLRPSGLAQSL